MSLPTLPLNQKMHGQYSAVWIQGFQAAASSIPALIQMGVKSSTVEEVFDEHDTSNTSVPVNHTYQKGKKHLEFTIEAEVDAALVPIDSAGIALQDDYFGFALVANSQTGAGTSASPGTPFYRGVGIGRIKFTAAQNDIIKVSITGKSTGAYQTYTGS